MWTLIVLFVINGGVSMNTMEVRSFKTHDDCVRAGQSIVQLTDPSKESLIIRGVCIEVKK